MSMRISSSLHSVMTTHIKPAQSNSSINAQKGSPTAQPASPTHSNNTAHSTHANNKPSSTNGS